MNGRKPTVPTVPSSLLTDEWQLSLVQKNKGLLAPAITRFATYYRSFASLIDLKKVLQTVVDLDDYPANSNTATASQKQAATEVQMAVSDPDFWETVGDCCTLRKPFAEVGDNYSLIDTLPFSTLELTQHLGKAFNPSLSAAGYLCFRE